MIQAKRNAGDGSVLRPRQYQSQDYIVLNPMQETEGLPGSESGLAHTRWLNRAI